MRLTLKRLIDLGKAYAYSKLDHSIQAVLWKKRGISNQQAQRRLQVSALGHQACSSLLGGLLSGGLLGSLLGGLLSRGLLGGLLHDLLSGSLLGNYRG